MSFPICEDYKVSLTTAVQTPMRQNQTGIAESRSPRKGLKASIRGFISFVVSLENTAAT